MRNALARMDQIKPVTDSITTDELRVKAQKVLIAAAKAAGVGNYEFKEQLAEMETRLKAFETELDQLKKPKDLPKQEPPKDQPCKCVLTKEGYWARFHQLRAEGLDQKDAYRILAMEQIEAAKNLLSKS